MENLNSWIMMLVGTYGLIAMCLVMLGMPIRPVAHLVKVTTLWFVVSWVVLGITLAVVL